MRASPQMKNFSWWMIQDECSIFRIMSDNAVATPSSNEGMAVASAEESVEYPSAQPFPDLRDLICDFFEWPEYQGLEDPDIWPSSDDSSFPESPVTTSSPSPHFTDPAQPLTEAVNQKNPIRPEASTRRSHPTKKTTRNRRKPLETKTLLAKSLVEWLENPGYNPDAIKWISREDGLFQITNSTTISNLWGNEKGNHKMNHEKLSRALRHYYKDGTLERIANKRKLCYKFSAAAMVKFKVLKADKS